LSVETFVSGVLLDGALDEVVLADDPATVDSGLVRSAEEDSSSHCEQRTFNGFTYKMDRQHALFGMSSLATATR
jgi:hypothetical protein